MTYYELILVNLSSRDFPEPPEHVHYGQSASRDQLAKLRKERRGVMRTWGGLRMILHTENRFGLMAQPLDSLIVQVDPIHSHIRGKGFRVYSEAMVLRGDLHLARLQVLHRLIPAPMAELQFKGLAAKGLSQDLVAQTDAENGNAALD